MSCAPWRGGGAGQEYFTAYLVEKALSIDNVFVFALLFQAFAVPAAYQHRVLFAGILGALALRAGFIAAGATVNLWRPGTVPHSRRDISGVTVTGKEEAAAADVACVGEGETLREAGHRMRELGVTALSVRCENGEDQGTITQDMVLRSIAAGRDPKTVTVGQVILGPRGSGRAAGAAQPSRIRRPAAV